MCVPLVPPSTILHNTLSKAGATGNVTESTAKGKEPRKWKRGSNANARNPAIQFGVITEVHGTTMWSVVCNVPVYSKDKSTACNHVKNERRAKSGYLHL